MKKILVSILSCMLIIGLSACSNGDSKNAIEQGKTQMNNREYEKAASSFQLALNKDENNKEAKELLDNVDKYINAKKSLDKNDFEKAKRLVEGISDKYGDSSMKEDVNKLKNDIKNAENITNKMNQNIGNLKDMIGDEKFQEAKSIIKEFKGKKLNDKQKAKVKEITEKVENGVIKITMDKKGAEDILKKLEEIKSMGN
ncbi:hypothetical protein CLPU_14c00300 [Gottschalkia purinilytica]|uniref:Lipoprotein n=1 Tax=Gottschalkia purinilytica TaxID=1503 RepID=A0A0L0W841_GOTPU|nr:hypothetical protein [Gottschalkia purinilytica]KNF07612.1 hypothetical protein CLPU_14c00300 [Gottschalkia purinilytica]